MQDEAQPPRGAVSELLRLDANGAGYVLDGRTGSPEAVSKKGDVFTINRDTPTVGCDQARDAIKTGGFARSVGTKQGNDFAPVQLKRYVTDYWSLAVAFAQFVNA